MEKDDFALLKVIASSIETIKEDIKEMKESVKTKVEHTDFNALKGEVEDLKKSKWTITGMALAGSYLITHFFK